MIKLALTNENYLFIAQQFSPKCEPEMVMAFNWTECKREPFDKDGFPAMLYERHIVYANIKDRSLARRLAQQYPSLFYPTGYGPGGYGSYADQRVKLSKAIQLLGDEKDAAFEGCSLGPYQELAENWEDYGFENVGQFVDTMKNGLWGACDIFVRSIKHRGLVTAMITRDYVTLAKKYNGRGYARFHYDTQLEDNYKIAKALKIDWTKVSPTEPKKNHEAPWLGQLLPVVDMSKHVEPDDPHGDVDVNSDINITPIIPNQPIQTGVTQQPFVIDNKNDGDVTVNQATQQPVVPPGTSVDVQKQSPSLFTRWMTAIKLAVGGFISTITAWYTGSQVTHDLVGKATDSITGEMVLKVIPILIFGVVGIVAGVVIIWIASRFYGESADRSNLLNQKLIEAAKLQNQYSVHLSSQQIPNVAPESWTGLSPDKQAAILEVLNAK